MKLTLYWKTGDRQVVEGENIAQVMTLAGYSQGAVAALDFYANGDNKEYERIENRWVKINYEKDKMPTMR